MRELSETSENRRKNAKTIGVFFVDFWGGGGANSGGHIAVAIEFRFPY